VEILVEVREGLPPIDLDNLAKAVLDGVKGALFFDDAQVARLLVERAHADVERLTIAVAPLSPRAISS
jgi:Holliday junction resolvase RusA-like endonuclease